MTYSELRERMKAGAWYNDLDAQLTAAREKSAQLSDEYNRSADKPREERESILRRLLLHVGAEPMIETGFHCEFGDAISLGDHFYANFGCVMLDGAPINIGDHVLLGPHVGLYTANHALDPEARILGACKALPITLGNRVWCGGGVQILPGVTIGDGSVIGAGSVVTHDIPAGVIAAGNPCRVLRDITERDRVNASEFLL